MGCARRAGSQWKVAPPCGIRQRYCSRAMAERTVGKGACRTCPNPRSDCSAKRRPRRNTAGTEVCGSSGSTHGNQPTAESSTAHCQTRNDDAAAEEATVAKVAPHQDSNAFEQHQFASVVESGGPSVSLNTCYSREYPFYLYRRNCGGLCLCTCIVSSLFICLVIKLKNAEQSKKKK